MWELWTVLMAAFLSSKGVILTPMSFVFFKLQHLQLHPWFCGLYPSRHAGWQDCQLANPTWWLQVHIPVEL
jgi:hypothetical protein